MQVEILVDVYYKMIQVKTSFFNLFKENFKISKILSSILSIFVAKV